MNKSASRRSFLAASAATVVTTFAGSSATAALTAAPRFQISLAEWSLHRTLFAGKMNHLDFAATAKKEFGIEAVEYVNQFFKDKASDAAYLADMNKRAADAGVKQLLIMIDGEGRAIARRKFSKSNLPESFFCNDYKRRKRPLTESALDAKIAGLWF